MPQPRAIVPDKGIRPGFNVSGAEIPKGRFVTRSVPPSVRDEIEIPSGPTDVVYGATMHALPDGQRGDIQLEGRAVAEAGGAVSENTLVTTDSAGRAVTAVTGNIATGLAVTDGGSGDEIEVELAGPSRGIVVP